MKESHIEISSFWAESVRNEYFDQDSEVLVIVMPGQVYAVGGPLLYYNVNMVKAMGYDVLTLHYGFQIGCTDFDYESEFVELVSEVDEVIQKSMKPRHDKVVFIGKDLGTLVQNHLIIHHKYDLAACIYLTPPPIVMDCIRDWKSLVIYGTSDQNCMGSNLSHLIEMDNVEVHSIEGANHSLDTQDPFESIDILKRVVTLCRDFLVLNLKD